MPDFAAKPDRLQESQPISLDSVDFDFVHPDIVREQFGGSFYYFGRTEGEVARNVDEVYALLPYLDDQTAFFLSIWMAQELPHGRIFEEAQHRLGQEPAPINMEVNPLFLAGNALARVPGIHDAFMTAYLQRGAVHERLTMQGYDGMIKRFRALGELAFCETALEPIRKQEAGHLGYYRMAAREQWARLGTFQRHLVRLLFERTYAIVGTTKSDVQRKTEIGQVFWDLSGADESTILASAQAIAKPVQAIARELLEMPHLKPVIFNALHEALEFARPGQIEPEQQAA